VGAKKKKGTKQAANSFARQTIFWSQLRERHYLSKAVDMLRTLILRASAY
tara:strand:- start:631 stop:780 length:150 start_codon:yes stop_codon:yes gene_type:complete